MSDKYRNELMRIVLFHISPKLLTVLICSWYYLLTFFFFLKKKNLRSFSGFSDLIGCSLSGTTTGPSISTWISSLKVTTLGWVRVIGRGDFGDLGVLGCQRSNRVKHWHTSSMIKNSKKNGNHNSGWNWTFFKFRSLLRFTKSYSPSTTDVQHVCNYSVSETVSCIHGQVSFLPKPTHE